MQTGTDITELLDIILDFADENMSQAARDCITALQIMLGGADAITLDEDSSGEISSVIIGTIDVTETIEDWAEERDVDYDILELQRLEAMH